MLSDKPIYYTSTREHDGEKCESMYEFKEFKAKSTVIPF